MSYLHGVETIQVDIQGVTFTVVKSGVIGLVGIAPAGPTNQLVLVNSDNDFSQFGASVPGFTIPQALEVIALQGAATVLVINVFDPAAHTSQVSTEAQTVAAGKLKLAFAPIGVVSIFAADGTTPSTYIIGTDYTLDAYGNFTVINPAITNGTVLKFTYKKLNLSAVTATVINGANTSGVRTGTTLWELAYNTYGFNPKILIAPGFSTLSPVATQLRVLADKYRAIDYCDAPAGTTVNTAIAGRGPAGSIASFNVAHARTELLYPQLLKFDAASNANVAFPYSAYLAGIRQAVDNDDTNGGFWVSSSNKAINCEGIEVSISASLNDPTSDNQLLNGAGITTVFNTYGTGIRTWGNRNSTFSANNQGPKTFTNLIRIDDIVSESMELASLPFVDLGITQAFIDVVREAGNSFIRTLIQRGALLPGSKVVYVAADNPPEQLANGQIVFERIYMGSTPAERITYKSILDITLLQTLK